uniref:Secreted protein n=1 Tax=Heterorhabditis bacteriophora TaxID=37862 RepID=A0A1I7WW75_HETBA
MPAIAAFSLQLTAIALSSCKCFAYNYHCFVHYLTYAANGHSQVDEEVTVEPEVLNEKSPDQIGLTEAELAKYKDDPFWRTIRCKFI